MCMQSFVALRCVLRKPQGLGIFRELITTTTTTTTTTKRTTRVAFYKSLNYVPQYSSTELFFRKKIYILNGSLLPNLDKHVSAVTCAACFFHLRRIRHSLDTGSATTLLHAFVMSRVDYSNSVFAGSPRVTTDKLQRLLNSAARVVSNTRRYDRGVSRLQHDKLHRVSR